MRILARAVAPLLFGCTILSAQAEARKLFSELEAECSFLSVELSALEDEVVASWWSDPKASRLRHWIEDVRKYRKHILSIPDFSRAGPRLAPFCAELAMRRLAVRLSRRFPLTWSTSS